MNPLRRASLVLTVSLFASWGGVARANPAGETPAGWMGAALTQDRGGLRVTEVTPGSAAERAGLHAGDLVVAARGLPPGTVESFTRSVRAAGPGATYLLTVVHDGRRGDLEVHLDGAPQRGGPVTEGQAAPSIGPASVAQGTDPADLSRLRGRVVLLDFWASWCGPCRMMMPTIDRLSQRFGPQGLTVLGLTDESVNIARSVGSQMGIHYTLASSPAALRSYQVEQLPTMVLIDRRGQVRSVRVGAEGPRALEQAIHRLLAEPAP